MTPERIPMAREGVPFIAFAALTTLTLALLEWEVPALIALALTAFVVNFFRDPERIVPDDPTAIISPADGKVILIEEVDDQEFLGQRARKVSIFMNVFNVHVNRCPCSGTVEKIVHRPGKFYSADSAKAALHNETCATLFSAAGNRRLAMVQMAGLIARRIVCRLSPGDAMGPGRRFGLIRFGSRVDLYLPLDCPITCQCGDKVRAGESIIARLG